VRRPFGGPTGAPAGVGGGGGISTRVPFPADVVCRGVCVGVGECSNFSSENMLPKKVERTDGMAGMRLSRPLGFGVV
jgi:hypothetical protein